MDLTHYKDGLPETQCAFEFISTITLAQMFYRNTGILRRFYSVFLYTNPEKYGCVVTHVVQVKSKCSK